MATSTLITAYLGFGTAASRPSTPSTDTNAAPFWYSTDTGALSQYIPGTGWVSVGGGYNAGTTPAIVQSASDNTGAQGVTLGVAPTNGNQLISMSFNPSVSTAGSGWTNYQQNGSGTDYGTIATKTAGASESATQNPLSSAPGTGCMCVWELSGVSSIIIGVSEAEQTSQTTAFSPVILPFDQKLIFLGAIGLVSTSFNITKQWGVTQDQLKNTGSSRQIFAGHSTLGSFPVPQIAAAFGGSSSYKALGLLLTA